MIENIKQIRQAIEIEQKHLYIDIRGKESTFSVFILKQLNFLYKKSNRNPQWLVLSKEFESYSMASVSVRRKAVQRLVSVLRKEIDSQGNINKIDSNIILK